MRLRGPLSDRPPSARSRSPRRVAWALHPARRVRSRSTRSRAPRRRRSRDRGRARASAGARGGDSLRTACRRDWRCRRRPGPRATCRPPGRWERQDLEGLRIRLGEHVALLHAAEAVDRGPVEGHPLLERVLELRRRDPERLRSAEDIGEPQLDEPNATLFDRPHHVFPLRLSMECLPVLVLADGSRTRWPRERSV